MDIVRLADGLPWTGWFPFMFQNVENFGKYLLFLEIVAGLILIDFSSFLRGSIRCNALSLEALP